MQDAFSLSGKKAIVTGGGEGIASSGSDSVDGIVLPVDGGSLSR